MKNNYHKENLDKTMLEQAIKMINEEGINNFSLRKLAIECGVSHNALYRHYNSKEDLIEQARDYVSAAFALKLNEAIKGEALNNPETVTKVGYAYLAFFKENPTFFKFIYDESHCPIILTLDEVPGNYEPFEVFRKCCLALTLEYKMSKEEGLARLVKCFGIVQGVTELMISKNITLDGSWDFVLERLFR